MQKFLLAALLLCVVIYPSCKKETTTSSTINAETLIDVSYGADAAQKMDVYLPANRSSTNTNVIFMIHGGAWLAGDKADFRNEVDSLKRNMPTYAIVNINYRLATLAGANKWPTQLNDVNLAYDFIASKATEYKINMNKVALVGASAGAQLALLKGYTANPNKNIKCVVDLFGPTNLIDLYNNPPDPNYTVLLPIFMSGTPTSNLANYNSASPLFNATASSGIPTIIFHGTADNVVPIRQSDSLHNRLQIAGVPRQYYKYQGEGHGWSGANLIDTYTKIYLFINLNML